MLSINRYFPFLAIIISLAAWYDPQPLRSLEDAIVPFLTIIMFCMGLTLRWQDFRRVWNKPQPIALGVLLQFAIMPLIAFLLVKILSLPDDLAIGLIIVGACAGGTASNVMTFLARGDVALSVSMTLMSTLWGVVLTPWLVAFYASANVQVDTGGMIFSIGKMVVLPILAGLLCNHYLPQIGRSIQSKLPDIASAFILAIIGIVVSLNAEEISTLGITTASAVIIHNLLGLALGYGIARWNGQTEAEARTIAIEIGMQNSGLGVALAIKFYGPVAALPGALFSVWHNISGSLLAAFWKWQIDQKIKKVRQ